LSFLGLFVTVFAEIHEPARPADMGGRRRSSRRGQPRVLPARLSASSQRDDAELFAVNSDDPDFAGADFAVELRTNEAGENCVEKKGGSRHPRRLWHNCSFSASSKLARPVQNLLYQ